MKTPSDPPCRACAHCYMEPSGPPEIICGHSKAGLFGKYIDRGGGPRSSTGFCGPNAKLFKQHPLRGPDGSLGSVNK